jgi:hypothetical protein
MFKQIISRLFSVKTPVLGRWCLIDKTKNHWKIDMANIDHCGTCTSKELNSPSNMETTKDYRTMKTDSRGSR